MSNGGVWVRLWEGEDGTKDLVQIYGTKIKIAKEEHKDSKYIFVRLLGMDVKGEWNINLSSDFIDESPLNRRKIPEEVWLDPLKDQYIRQTLDRFYIIQEMIWDYIKNNKCIDLEELENIVDGKQEEKRRKIFENFIEKYLTPSNINDLEEESFNKMLSFGGSFDIRYFIGEIEDHIKSMDYQDFLKTLYWKSVAQLVKTEANGECCLCSSKNKLHVHHKKYDLLGREFISTANLIVLCQNCHKKFHNK